MTTSRLFAQPPARTSVPWLTLITLVVACLSGAIMMSYFIDALHLSMARGEAFRAGQRSVAPANLSAAKDKQIALLRLVQADR